MTDTVATDIGSTDTPPAAGAEVLPAKPTNIPEFLCSVVGTDVAWEPNLIPEGRPPWGVSFPPGPTRAAAIEAWYAQHNDTNSYYHFAAMKRPLNGRAKEADVHSTQAIVVDADMLTGMPFYEAGAKLDELRGIGWPQDVPLPTGTINSGGGLQFIWLLEKPFVIGVDGSIEDVKRYGRGLHYAIGDTKLAKVDGTFSLDHLFRTPYTINHADLGKRLKNPGRPTTGKAMIVEWHANRVYRLDQLPAAETRSVASAGAVSAGPIDASNVVRLKTLDELPVRVSARIQKLIFEGEDKKRYQSRSEALYAVIWALLAACATDQLIFSIITDPKLKISESVLDKPDSAGYAIRQIEHAKANMAAKEAADAAERGPIVPDFDHMARAQMFCDANRPHLVDWQGDAWDYDAGRYVVIDESELGSDVTKWLRRTRARRFVGGGEWRVVPFDPNEKSISETMTALGHLLHLSRRKYVQPCWIGKPDWLAESGALPKPADVISFPNGILDVITDEFRGASPKLFTSFAAGFDYDPDAAEPTKWLAFLDEVFCPGDDPKGADAGLIDKDQIALLQECFGYCLTADTRHQKAFMFLGETRSGKGTMMRMLQALLPAGATAGPSFQDLGTNFGLSQLVGKQVAIIDDVQIEADTRHKDLMVQNIKRITGGSTMSFDRKFKSHYIGPLPITLIVLANEMVQLRDKSGALANRFYYFRTRNSFLDRVDPNLFERDLEPEIAGVLKWALAGLRRVRKNGKFTQTKAHDIEYADFADHGNPVGKFVRSRCALRPEAMVPKAAMFAEYQRACNRDNVLAGNTQALSSALVKLYPRQINIDYRPRVGDPEPPPSKQLKQVPHYRGIRLLTAAERVARGDDLEEEAADESLVRVGGQQYAAPF